MKNAVKSLMIFLVLGIGSISCEMGTNFDEVVVANSVQDHESPDIPDNGKPGGGN